MIFQDPMASLNPRHSIRRILTEPLFLHGMASDRPAAESLFGAPRHPYTEALLSAVPVPVPGALRERIVLQ
eukprot:gene20621-25281_t